MEILCFLEKLANSAHYNLIVDEIVDEQNGAVKQAFKDNDVCLIREQFIHSGILANMTHVMIMNIPG